MEEQKTVSKSSDHQHSSGNSILNSCMNATVLHIVGEVIAFVGITIYFSRKVSNLNQQIEEMKSELEEQGNAIQRHEELLKKLVGMKHTQPSSIRHVKFQSTPQVAIPPIATPSIVELNLEEPNANSIVDLDEELREELSEMDKSKMCTTKDSCST